MNLVKPCEQHISGPLGSSLSFPGLDLFVWTHTIKRRLAALLCVYPDPIHLTAGIALPGTVIGRSCKHRFCTL